MGFSSIINGIIATIAKSDSYAMSEYEIDSKAELDMLGKFLNGQKTGYESQSSYTKNDLSNADIAILEGIYKDLEAKLSNVDTKSLYYQIMKFPEHYSKKEYLNEVKKIDENNIFNLDRDIISSIFTNQRLSKKNKIKVFKHIAEILLKKGEEMKKYIPENEFNSIEDNVYGNFDNIKNEIENLSFDDMEKAENLLNALLFITKSKLRKKYAKYKESKKADNEINNDELQHYASEYLKKHPNEIKNNSIIFGTAYNHIDGNFFKKREVNDKDDLGKANITTQTAGNCWLMGGLNSMSVHEKSKNYMNSLIYADSLHGIYVVKIPEAENEGLGEDGKGIYIVTTEDLKKDVEFSNGDRDIAIFNKAVSKYFYDYQKKYSEATDIQTIIDEPSLSGNTTQRFYELIRGEKSTWFENDQIPNGVGKTYIGHKKAEENKQEIDKLYDALIEHFKNGGEITLGLSLNEFGHAASVVGITEDGKLIIQESNNSQKMANYIGGNTNNVWQDKNDIWNIVLDKETFIKLCEFIATNKF